MRTVWLLLTATLAAGGCGTARTADVYRDDTRKLLDQKGGQLKACYDGVLKTDPKAGGKVVVRFAIEAKTGRLVEAQIDAGSTAPERVRQCVLASLGDITLDPGDRRRGVATWSWDFSAAPDAH
jgi:hypothetical protein